MSEFLSLYRRDYRWPRLKPPFERTDLRCKLAAPMTIEQAREKELKCGPQRYADVDEDAPKLGKIGPCPKTIKLEYTEEDACLKKLLEENPNLLSVMRKKPVTDVLGQFNKDRLTSTYQADFDHTKDPSPEEATLLCGCKANSTCPGDDNDPSLKEPECKSKHVSRKQLLRMVYGPGYCAPGPPCTKGYIPQQKPRKKPQFDDGCQPEYKRKCIPKWTSEYREAISSTGLDIMRDVRVQARRKCRQMRKKSDRKECEKNLTLIFG